MIFLKIGYVIKQNSGFKLCAFDRINMIDKCNPLHATNSNTIPTFLTTTIGGIRIYKDYNTYITTERTDIMLQENLIMLRSFAGKTRRISQRLLEYRGGRMPNGSVVKQFLILKNAADLQNFMA